MKPSGAGTTAGEPFWARTVQGLRALVATPEQRLLRGTSAAMYAVAGAIPVLVATLTQLRLHLPAGQAGFVFGAMGVGGLLGSALAPRLYSWGWRRGLAVVFALAGIGLLGLALAGTLSPGWGFVVALLANALSDGAVSVAFVLVGAMTTLLTPPDLRGRVDAASAIYSFAARGVAVIGRGGALHRRRSGARFRRPRRCVGLAASFGASRRT